MDQITKAYISGQAADRQELLSQLHKLMLDNDSTVTPEVGLMMGKEMIIYKARGMMKYALASGKSHMSLHVLPMYMDNNIFVKYQALLPKAKFQKGCINFEGGDVLPLNIVKDLITDCAPVDLVANREKLLAEKKLKLKSKG